MITENIREKREPAAMREETPIPAAAETDEQAQAFPQRAPRSVDYALISDTTEKQALFLQMALTIAEQYRLDIKIRQDAQEALVQYTFACGGDMQCLRPLLNMTDSCTLLQEKDSTDILVVLRRRTQTMVWNGKPSAPIPYTVGED